MKNKIVEETKIQYYWCVNCGYHGNFGRPRSRGVTCQKCDYDCLTQFSLEEIREFGLFQFNDVVDGLVVEPLS